MVHFLRRDYIWAHVIMPITTRTQHSDISSSSTGNMVLRLQYVIQATTSTSLKTLVIDSASCRYEIDGILRDQ